MDKLELQEKILSAWILINGKFKETKLTDELTYNEAVVLKNVYDNFVVDGVGKTSLQSLIEMTGISKSLMNRTIDSLFHQGFLKKMREGRKMYVFMVKEKVNDFLRVHNNSLKIAERVMEVIGEEDAESFVRIAEKLSSVDSGRVI